MTVTELTPRNWRVLVGVGGKETIFFLLEVFNSRKPKFMFMSFLVLNILKDRENMHALLSRGGKEGQKEGE